MSGKGWWVRGKGWEQCGLKIPISAHLRFASEFLCLLVIRYA